MSKQTAFERNSCSQSMLVMLPVTWMSMENIPRNNTTKSGSYKADSEELRTCDSDSCSSLRHAGNSVQLLNMTVESRSAIAPTAVACGIFGVGFHLEMMEEHEYFLIFSNVRKMSRS